MAISSYRFNQKVLPILFDAELQCKRRISQALWLGKSLVNLRYELSIYTKSIEKRLDGIEGIEPYIKGFKAKISKMLNDAQKQRDRFVEMASIMAMVLAVGKDDRKNERIKKALSSPKDFLTLKKAEKDYIIDISQDFSQENGYDVWAMRKGAPTPVDYEEKLNAYIEKLASENLVTSEDGKKNQSIWQRAELEVRYDAQMEMLQEVSSKFDLAYTDTHPNCSERCEKWQGKLFDLKATKSQLSGHRMNYKIEGKTVYCLKEIMAIKDKYGYTNNIINGFNCRHSLIGFHPGDLPPRAYTKKEIENERAKDQYMREMEREIRALKQKYAVLTDKKRKDEIKDLIDKKTEHYKEFCKRNGYAFYPYRLGI